jgi:hypothetical protein
MSMHLTLVLVGVGIAASGLLREGRRDRATGQVVFARPRHARTFTDEAATQTERRFDLIDLDPFRYDTPQTIAAWVTHLAGVEDNLRLLRAEPGMLTDGAMPEYLFRRTGGIVGLLERLIEDGAAHAIDTGAEQLTTDLLDTIDINLGNLARRDTTAGEIPDIPPRPAPAAGKNSKRRNTVFDDHGGTSGDQPTASTA